MSGKVQIFCGWCGIVTMALVILGWGPLAHITPPLSPHVTPAEIATLFTQNANGILWGMFLVNIGVATSIALVVGISVQILRIESATSPIMSYLHLALGTTASLLVMFPAMIMNVAVYRLDRAPDTMLLLHDIAVFFTYMPFSVATLEMWVIATAIFSDRSAEPIFPRWLGYYNLLVGLSLVPMGLIGLEKDGVLASDGLLGWWIPTALAAPWYILMGVYVIKAGKASIAHQSGAVRT